MKSIKSCFNLILACAILAAVAACGAGQAHAADITFKATDGQVFGTKNVVQYEMYAAGGSYVKVTYLDGSNSLFADSGSLAGRILQALPQLVNVPGTNVYIDPSFAARVVCGNGSSIISFPSSGMQVQAVDNCAMFIQIQAKAK